MIDDIAKLMIEAEQKAIDNLARYKFSNFGYWCAIWVYLNRINGGKKSNPFKDFVELARSKNYRDVYVKKGRGEGMDRKKDMALSWYLRKRYLSGLKKGRGEVNSP